MTWFASLEMGLGVSQGPYSEGMECCATFIPRGLLTAHAYYVMLALNYLPFLALLYETCTSQLAH